MLRTALMAVVVVAGALALWLALRSAPSQKPAGSDPAPTAETAPSTAPEASPPRQPAPLAPQLRYPEARIFTDDVRQFFDSAAELPDDERERRAAALRERIAEQEREGTLLPQEALLLRLALLRATIEDPAVLDHEIRSLSESYREAEAARPPAAADPRFELYKRRESEVVREVMVLERIPDGLTREEYLRRRLRELRSEIYSGAADGPETR